MAGAALIGKLLPLLQKEGGKVKRNLNQAAGTGITLGTYLANRKDLKAPIETVESIAQQQGMNAANLYTQLGDRPEMDAQVNRLKSLYDLAQGGLPEETMSAATQDIQQTQAQALRDIGTRGGGLRGVGSTQANVNRAFRDLNALDAETALSNTMNIGQQLATAEAMQEMYNEISPYEEMFGRIQGMIGASQQNRMLASNLRSNLASQNIQMGADIGGALYAKGASQGGGQDGGQGSGQGGGGLSSLFGGQPSGQSTSQTPQLGIDTSAFTNLFQGGGFSGGM